jgi:rod shape-determining protein MreC
VITNLTPDSRIKPGEQVLTSGGDQVYPRGLTVGTIESITPDPEHQPYTLIQVKPSTNLFQLEEVLVITGTQGDLPAIAQKDLARGVATAQEIAAAKAAAEEAAAEAAAKSAAQIIAEKLPSVHEGEQPDKNSPADATKPATTPPVIPKPSPTLHPDRYTSGTTPPASSLKPGAEHSATTYTAPAVRPEQSASPSQPGTEGEDSSPTTGTPSTPKKNQTKPESARPDN